MKNNKLLEHALKEANKWISICNDKDIENSIKKLIESNLDELIDSFYKKIEFGTSGIRGIMGVGTNRINKYTIAITSLGLAKYLKKKFTNQNISIAIAYDVRENSNIYANIAANIFSLEKIKVYLFDSFRPTPELSYTVIKLSCQAGVVLTASHNTYEYNGFKIYREDGSQITYPEDKYIIKEINKINIKDISFKKNISMIEIIGNEIDTSFINKCIKHTTFSMCKKDLLKIVFTPLHGTSIKIIPKTLKKAGFKNLIIVKEQSNPDGKFSTVKSPNPEEISTFDISLKISKIYNADIIISTDPDADRFGIAIKDKNKNMIILNGNESNTLLIYYLLSNYKILSYLNKKSFIVSTVVSSDIFLKIAKLFNIKCKLTLTGFKWISKLVRESKKEEFFIGAGEESLGFMMGNNFIKDKDSITSILLISEMASLAKEKGSSLYEELVKIYKKVGCYKESFFSIKKNGVNANYEINKIVEKWRKNPPIFINKSKVIYIEDYLIGVKKCIINNKIFKLKIPKSNIIIYRTEDNTKIAIRPSGTEQKLKFYLSVNKNFNQNDNYYHIEKNLNIKIKKITNELIYSSQMKIL